jgi:hypothetical protein
MGDKLAKSNAVRLQFAHFHPTKQEAITGVFEKGKAGFSLQCVPSRMTILEKVRVTAFIAKQLWLAR